MEKFWKPVYGSVSEFFFFTDAAKVVIAWDLEKLKTDTSQVVVREGTVAEWDVTLPKANTEQLKYTQH